MTTIIDHSQLSAEYLINLVSNNDFDFDNIIIETDENNTRKYKIGEKIKYKNMYDYLSSNGYRLNRYGKIIIPMLDRNKLMEYISNDGYVYIDFIDMIIECDNNFVLLNMLFNNIFNGVVKSVNYNMIIKLCKYYVKNNKCDTIFETNLFYKLAKLCSKLKRSHKYHSNFDEYIQILQFLLNIDYDYVHHLNYVDSNNMTTLNILLEIKNRYLNTFNDQTCENIFYKIINNIGLRMIEKGMDVNIGKNMLDSLFVYKCCGYVHMINLAKKLIRLIDDFDTKKAINNLILYKHMNSANCAGCKFDVHKLESVINTKILYNILKNENMVLSYDLLYEITQYYTNIDL